jgi:LPXTG-motif cell wall-anchored protein
MTARAELDGLGPGDGPVVAWAVPGDFAQAQPSVALPVSATPWPASSGTKATYWGSWLGLACLLLVVVLLLSRTRSKGPLH